MPKTKSTTRYDNLLAGMPIVRITTPHVPLPAADILADMVLPSGLAA